MINIEKLLNNSSLDDWKINGTKTETYELFFVHSKLETVRATDTDAIMSSSLSCPASKNVLVIRE